MKRNANMNRLKASYLFPQIHQRKRQFLAEHPEASLISLGVGDTTEPIPPTISSAMAQTASQLSTVSGYKGYGPEQGLKELREQIASTLYSGHVSADEVFISDGAKCDLGRLQILFGGEASIAVQDPSYPVYVDGSIMQGVNNIVYMPCTPENNFFPDLSRTPRTDLIYFCSPNNPTGATATRKQLEQLVAFAKANRSIIIFDSAYAHFIQDSSIPKSIFDIAGAHEVALEISSFSKIAGFTGVRLGWTVVPEALKYDDGTSVKADWYRIMSTIFNGASVISQAGGLAVLTPQGLKEAESLVAYYLENARIIKETMKTQECEVFGGDNAPYLWIRFPSGNSWDVFEHFLHDYHIVTTPGSGFGPSGESFIRMTAFGHRESIVEATRRIKAKTM